MYQKCWQNSNVKLLFSHQMKRDSQANRGTLVLAKIFHRIQQKVVLLVSRNIIPTIFFSSSVKVRLSINSCQMCRDPVLYKYLWRWTGKFQFAYEILPWKIENPKIWIVSFSTGVAKLNAHMVVWYQWRMHSTLERWKALQQHWNRSRCAPRMLPGIVWRSVKAS